MRAAFDDSALSYDDDFTDTLIGRMQRNRVWHYLLRTYKDKFPQDVFELNCGTGEDAMFFARNGSEVLATDISENMLKVTRQKVKAAGFDELVKTNQLDISSLHDYTTQKKFDLIFSNFGGLNCINEEQLSKLIIQVSHLLKPGGRLILVLMPRFCAWETFYYLCKLNYKKAFRRFERKVQRADLGANFVNIWYHHPSAVKKAAGKHFKFIHIQPIGITVPPSYMQQTFISRKAILNTLNAFEKKIGTFKRLSGIADHYLIDLQLR